MAGVYKVAEPPSYAWTSQQEFNPQNYQWKRLHQLAVQQYFQWEALDISGSLGTTKSLSMICGLEGSLNTLHP